MQRAVIKQMREEAAARSAAARETLLTRLVGLGYTEADLEAAIEYLRERVLVQIQFNPDKSLTPRSWGAPTTGPTMIDGLLESMVYKNQFDTKISSGSLGPTQGSSRDGWEKTIFMGGYHDGIPELLGPQRPKYGTFNAKHVWDGGAGSYGKCSFVLKPSVKARTTVTPGDSSGARAEQVGTADAFLHVLAASSDNRIRSIMNAALNRHSAAAGYGASSDYGYTEAQYHGPIDLATDVEYIVAHPSYRGTPYEAKLRQLAKQAGVPLRWRVGETMQTVDDDGGPEGDAAGADDPGVN